MALCTELYKRFHKDIFVITRKKLCDTTIEKLNELNKNMKMYDNRLYFAVSLCADESYYIAEQKEICASPDERLSNLRSLYNYGINTILLLRSVFPNDIVPTQEYIGLIEKSSRYIAAVISSGLIVTDNILKKLGMDEMKIEYLSEGDSQYLNNIEREKIKYVNTKEELREIQTRCEELAIPFFEHSMPALNALERK